MMRVCFYRDHCDNDFLNAYGGLETKVFFDDLKPIKDWMSDDNKNGGGAQGGGYSGFYTYWQGPESA